MHWHKLLFFTLCISVALVFQISAQDIFSDDIMEVRIDFAEDDWHEVLKDQKQRNDKTGLLASVTIGGVQHDSVRIRYKGNSSFHGALKAGVRKLPFKLKTKKDDLFFGGYQELKLSNNYRDPSAVRELLAYKIVGTYMPVPKVNPAIVYVNDRFVGVYTVTEGVEKPMLRRYFKSEHGLLIKCEPDFKASTPAGCPGGSFASLQYLGEETRCYEGLYEVEDPVVWEGLITLALALAERPEHVGNFINIDQVLWMHALNNVLVNLDSYLGIFCHNYYMYQDTTGLFHPLIWDLNLSFGGFSGLKQGLNPDLVKLSPIVHAREQLENRPLLTQLLKIESNRHTYYAHMRTIVEDWFLHDQYLSTAQDLQATLRPWVQKETGGFYNLSDFDKSIMRSVKKGDGRTVIGIVELMQPRTDYLSEHPLLRIREVTNQ